jgi:outer membrane protein OmpA-like peptidoglycan-associated protein
MALSHCKTAGRLASTLLVGGFIWSAAALPASAQNISSDQIINALSPPLTRSLTAPAVTPLSPADQAFVDGLRHRNRSLSMEESEHVASLAKDRAKIDLEIYFDYNSAVITPKAEPQLKQLGDALKSSRLEHSVLVVSGHTDAKGGDQYNQQLSERRAEAVKTYLINTLKVSSDNLSTAGYGKRVLKNKADPYAAENRRVEVVNMNATAQASR